MFLLFFAPGLLLSPGFFLYLIVIFTLFTDKKVNAGALFSPARQGERI
jgi:hypothetical protein